MENDRSNELLSCYDLPIGMKIVRKLSILRLLPISPTFTGFKGIKADKRARNDTKDDMC